MEEYYIFGRKIFVGPGMSVVSFLPLEDARRYFDLSSRMDVELSNNTSKVHFIFSSL